MVLCAHNHGSYLLESKFRSLSGGIFFVAQEFNQSDNNEAILTISQMIKNVMELASEAECTTLFIYYMEGIVARTTLE